MDYLGVLLAGLAGFVFGSVWYGVLARPWREAAGLTEEQVQAGMRTPTPFIIALVGAVLCAGMMRHVFATAGVFGLWDGFVSGVGAGAFIAAPWLMTNYAFAQRPRKLMIIDAGYAMGGCASVGAVLGWWMIPAA